MEAQRYNGKSVTFIPYRSYKHSETAVLLT